MPHGRTVDRILDPIGVSALQWWKERAEQEKAGTARYGMLTGAVPTYWMNYARGIR